MNPVLVEVVATSVEDALAAEQAGAGRIELCSAIELDGLTPSIGLVAEVVERLQIPVVALIRPRPGGFQYSEGELQTMRRDIEAVATAGVDGIAFGILTSDGSVDEDACRTLLAGCCVESVFHRAFDTAADPFRALASLQSVGFDRVLTSGHSRTALEGVHSLREMSHAAAAPQIVAAGGIRSYNAAEVCRLSEVREIHMGPMKRDLDERKPFGAACRLDFEEVRATIEAVRNAIRWNN